MQPNPDFLSDVEAEFPDKDGSSLIVVRALRCYYMVPASMIRVASSR